MVTLLDVSPEALRTARARLAGYGDRVDFVVADVVSWTPTDTVDAWHDRAVFHFLTDLDDQRRYARTAAQAVRSGGLLVMGTFAADGPTQCSGLPTARHDADSLSLLFSDAFELEHAEREEHVTPSGTVQPFTWVVLRRTPTG
jgi:SAM-dependent methyltransferase